MGHIQDLKENINFCSFSYSFLSDLLIQWMKLTCDNPDNTLSYIVNVSNLLNFCDAIGSSKIVWNIAGCNFVVHFL